MDFAGFQYDPIYRKQGSENAFVNVGLELYSIKGIA